MSRLFALSPALWACLVLAAPAVAQENPPPAPIVAPEISPEPEVALDELIRRALQNNPQLPIARETVEAARQRVGAARSLGNPVLQVVPGIGNREARDEEIILSQPMGAKKSAVRRKKAAKQRTPIPFNSAANRRNRPDFWCARCR